LLLNSSRILIAADIFLREAVGQRAWKGGAGGVVATARGALKKPAA